MILSIIELESPLLAVVFLLAAAAAAAVAFAVVDSLVSDFLGGITIDYNWICIVD